MTNKKGEYIKRFSGSWLESARRKGKLVKLSKNRHGKVLVELSFEETRKRLMLDARELESTGKRAKRVNAQRVKSATQKTKGSLQSGKYKLLPSHASAVNQLHPIYAHVIAEGQQPYGFARKHAGSSDRSVSDTVPPSRRPPKK